MTTVLPQRKYSPAVQPPALVPSVYGPDLPSERAKDYPGMVSLQVREIFPDIPEGIYRYGEPLTAVRAAADRALAGVDMSMIQPNHRVNVLCSEHGFGMDGGFPYAEMLTAVRDAIVDRTGCHNVKLVVVAWLGRKEPQELIDFFGLDERFHGKVVGATPQDAGIEIETVLGTLHGLRQVYNADWIIHTHYDDPREIYLHRMIDRIAKPFGMSYARMETRSVFHMQMGPRSGNLIGRAIADSEFVRSKLAFSIALLSSPDGITGVEADNDLDTLGNRVTVNVLSNYGKMLALFRAITDCVPIIDGTKWAYYVHAGGMIFGHLFFSGRDWWDLEMPDNTASLEELTGAEVSLAIKALVINHSLTGLTVLQLPMMYPVVTGNPAMAQAMRHDFSNPEFMEYAEEAPDLMAAIDLALERAGGCDKLICFDGLYGAINLSPSMADHLLELAPECSREVDEELLPRWLKQRGLDPVDLVGTR
jgi:hypothetical protein